jgi:hypothetical protein
MRKRNHTPGYTEGFRIGVERHSSELRSVDLRCRVGSGLKEWVGSFVREN